MKTEYVVLTDTINWGVGSTLVEAMRNAQVTPQNKLDIRVMLVAEGDEIKLSSWGGFYWKDEKTKEVTRISGENLFTAFAVHDVLYNMANCISDNGKDIETARALEDVGNDYEFKKEMQYCTPQ